MKNFLKDYKNQIEKIRKTILASDIPKLTDELFDLFGDTGNRLEYENVYFVRRKYLSVFAISGILYGRDEDVKILEHIIEEICEEKCWALPAHVDKSKENWQCTIDLFAAETAFYLADICSRMKGLLSKEIQDKVRIQVEERVLKPYMNANGKYAWWEECDMNWNAVCNASIGIAGICLLEEDTPEEKQKKEMFIKRICRNLTYYIEGFKDDGTCLEGLSYYNYGMYFFIWFNEYLEEYSHKSSTLLSNEKCQKIAEFMGECYLPEATPYSKFAYSTKYAFSVMHSPYNFGEAAPDSVLSFEYGGQLFIRRSIDNGQVTDGKLISDWSPFVGIKVHSEIIPTEKGHRRIHTIESDYDCVAYDAGFAMPVGDNSCTVKCIRGEGEELVLRAEPNTNILHSKTDIPVVKFTIAKGKNVVETEIVY